MPPLRRTRNSFPTRTAYGNEDLVDRWQGTVLLVGTLDRADLISISGGPSLGEGPTRLEPV